MGKRGRRRRANYNATKKKTSNSNNKPNGRSKKMKLDQLDSGGGGTSPRKGQQDTLALAPPPPPQLHPMEIFPEEIWLTIFEKIEDGRTLLSCSNTCTSFDKLLSPKKKNFLFSEIIQHVITKLPKEDLLNCRLVCRQWKDAVDKINENHPLHLRFNESEFWCEVSEFEWMNEGNVFSSAEEINKFLKDMETHTGNPFPGRCVEVFDNGESEVDYWASVKLLFERFGEHIWYLYITHYEDEQMARDIRDFLTLAPNLKKLKLEGSFDDEDDGGAEVNTSISEYFRNNPLPMLSHVETLAIYAAPAALSACVLRSSCDNNRLKRVDLQGKSYEWIARFNHLEEICDEIGSDEDLMKLKGARWPLKILNLDRKFDWSDWSQEKVFSFRTVFGSLLPFKNTLVTANLKLTVNATGEDLKFGLNLPHLKNLYVEYTGPLDVFLPLKSLENLKIRKFQSKSRKGCVMKVYGFEYRMYSSNIWELLPALKTFAFQGQSKKGYVFNEFYTRDRFDFYYRD